MDIGKILLLYMSLSLASTIGTTEVPTVVTEDATVNKTIVAETATADIPVPVENDGTLFPSSLPVPSLPENVNGQEELAKTPSVTVKKGVYKLVKLNDRGTNVRNLQKRLIELGYLSTEDEDGVFGKKTQEAVKEFQKANGLSRDGVAGDTTLTYLYDYNDVVARTTPAPAATDTPSSEETLPSLEAAGAVQDSLQVIPDGKIVFQGANSPVTILTMVDGVVNSVPPHVWTDSAENIYISLQEMADAFDGWSLETDEKGFIFATSSHIVKLQISADETICTVDGDEVSLVEGSYITYGSDVRVTSEFLQKTVADSLIWDADEKTLIVDIK